MFGASKYIWILCPKWFVSLLSAIATSGMFIFALKLSNISISNFTKTICLTTVLIFALPWYDQLFYLAFHLNYVWSSVMCLIFLYLFFKGKNYSLISNIGLSLFSLSAGMMHEGASIPLVIGILAYIILSQKRLFPTQLSMLVCFFLGAAFVIFSNGLQNRIATNHTPRELSLSIIYLLSFNITTFIFIIVSIFCIARRSFSALLQKQIIIYLIASVCGYFIFITNPVLRASWFPTLYAIIGIALLIHNTTIPDKAKKVFYLLSIALSIISISHLLVYIHYSINLNTEYRLIISQYKANKCCNFFSTITQANEIHWFALGKPYGARHQQWGGAHFKAMAEYYNSPNIYPIPMELRNLTFARLVKIHGNNPFYQWNNFIISTDIHNDHYLFSIQPITIFSFKFSKKAKVTYSKFISADNTIFYLVSPNYQALPNILDNIAEINEL